MGVADADKALAGVVHHAIGEVRGGVNGFLRRQVGQPNGERWSHLPAFAQHHVFLRKTRLLEIVGAKHDSDAGQFVGDRDEPSPVMLLLIEEQRVAGLFG